MPSNTLRPRLQLSLGALAVLGEELPSLGGRRLFAASCRESGAELRITLHPAPPEGPSSTALQERVARLRQLAHPALAVPVGTGDLDGRPWVAEVVLRAPTAMQRLGDGGALGVRQGILALRGVTRAVASLHRAGMAHGGLDLDAVHITPSDVQIGGFASTPGNNQRADLDALGPLAWAFFTGDLPDGPVGKLSDHRRGIPAGLDQLVSSLMAADPASRPVKAEAVLGVLDAFPTIQPSSISSFLEGAGRGTRTPRAREAVLLLVLVGLSVLVSSLVLGH
ncbi:MAG: hypothetical protein ABIZ70_11855 [Gemmatimonadales bacterium]